MVMGNNQKSVATTDTNVQSDSNHAKLALVKKVSEQWGAFLRAQPNYALGRELAANRICT